MSQAKVERANSKPPECRLAVFSGIRCLDCGSRFLSNQGLASHYREKHMRKVPRTKATDRLENLVPEIPPSQIPASDHRSISARVLSMVATCGNLCHWCKKPFRLDVGAMHPQAPTREHLIPRSYGGDGQAANLVLVHARCNQLRGTIHADAFHRLMRGEAVTRAEMWPAVFGDDK